jgi:hypothetical protein
MDKELQFKVTAKGSHPKRKTIILGMFEKRQQARNFCRNRKWQYLDLEIIHPDGKREVFK